MLKLATFFLDNSIQNKSDYAEKYEEMLLSIDKDGNEQQNICPKCGGKLVPRVAKKGNYAGREFYGCCNYPDCRYIVVRHFPCSYFSQNI